MKRFFIVLTGAIAIWWLVAAVTAVVAILTGEVDDGLWWSTFSALAFNRTVLALYGVALSVIVLITSIQLPDHHHYHH